MVHRQQHGGGPLRPLSTLLSDGRVLVPDGLLNGEHTDSAEVKGPATGPQTGTLAGIVTDAGTESPLKGVQVTIGETGQSAKTNSSGNYTINEVRVGDITVVATKRSYETQQISATISGGETTLVDFDLVH